MRTAETLVALIDRFREAGNPDYLLQQKTYKLGPLTVEQWGQAFRENRLQYWSRFVDYGEKDIAPDTLIEFVNLLDTFRQSHQITVQDIIDSATSYNKREKKWPSMYSGVIDDAPLDAHYRTWNAISQAIAKKRFGLTDENCGDENGPYKSLPDLLIRKGLKKPPIKNLKISDIKQAAHAFFEKNGRWPAQYDGQIEHEELSKYDITWDAVNRALDKKHKYLEPCSYHSIPELLVGEGLRNAKAHISVQSIRISAFATWLHSVTEENSAGRWPIEYDGLVLHGPLADGRTTWSAINSALSSKLRGITNENCPYNTLHDFLVGEGLIVEPSDFTTERIAESVFQTWEASLTPNNPNGIWPTAERGLILHGPLADGTTTWRMINDAIYNKNRGLTQENCPYTGLHDFMVKVTCMPDTKLRNLTLVKIKQSASETFAKTGRWPTDRDKVIEYGPIANGHVTWNLVDQAIRGKHSGMTKQNCKYNTLSQLLIGEGLKLPYRYKAPVAAPENPAPG